MNIAYYIILSVFLVLYVLNPAHFMERHFVMVVAVGVALILWGVYLFKIVVSDFPLLMRLGLFCLMPFLGGILFVCFLVKRW